MSPTNRLIRLIPVAAMVALTACSSVKLEEPTTAPVQDRSPASTDTAGSGTAPMSRGASQDQGRNAGLDPLNDPSSPLSKRSIYFNYDEFTVRTEYKPLLEAHARYLQANRQRTIMIEGNTDERGGREYNLALGQKRAEAVRKALNLLGVPDAQMEAVSMGEEKLRAQGGDEAAHAENRRADIVYR